jgi:hypothetical protein
LEELLLAFGIDVNELKQYASQSESSLAKGSQLEVREPSFRFQFNSDTGFENQEACLLRMNAKDVVGLFPPPLHKYLDPKRYRYAVIGTKDDTMGDLIPSRSLVDIDVMQNAVQMSGWTSVRERPIYLVWHNHGHSCCWCQVQGNELTLLPYPLSHQPVRYLFKVASGSLCNRPSDKLLASSRSTVRRSVVKPMLGRTSALSGVAQAPFGSIVGYRTCCCARTAAEEL